MELPRIGSVSCGLGPGVATGKGCPSGYLSAPGSQWSGVLVGQSVRRPARLPPWPYCLPAWNRLCPNVDLGDLAYQFLQRIGRGRGIDPLPPPPRLNLW